MFTGLVEGLGIVEKTAAEGPAVTLVIAPPAALHDGCAVGESVAINGCCLTVVATSHDRWEFQAGPETLGRTNLGTLVPGARVNLERALPVSARLGGHFVQGHVDCVARVLAVESRGEWVTMRFSMESAMSRHMVSKGSIAIDGVSLTLVDVDREQFSVALIPHTLEMTTLGTRKPGDMVNIETDILAKYVEKLLQVP
jgi:riboflavin synthase